MSVPLVKTENPYVGPNPFTTEDQHRFFGRDQEISDLVTLLVADRIVLLFAPSGAGKTSLIQAGLIPAMESRDFLVLPIIRVSEPPAAHAADSTAPNRYVRSALLSLSKEGAAPDLPSVGPAGVTFGEYLDHTDRQAAAANGNEPKLVVLIFDQFEEILTVDPTDIEAKDAFFTEVGTALRPPHRWALFSIREDYLAAFDSYHRRIPTQLATTFRLDLLGPDAARQAIQQPARNAGVDFTDAAATKLVEDLRQVRIQRADGTMEERLGPYVEPVQLQVVCGRTWQQLPPGATAIEPGDIAAQGSVNEALSAFYADAVADVASATGVLERDIRTWFNDRLITRQGIRDQILSTPPRSGGLDNRAIGLLVDKHLVRKEERRGTTWFELAHDRLIGPVRQNNAEWFDANLSPLQRQAYLWDSQDRNETFLFNPAGLAEAEAWLKTYSGRLTDVEQDFLEECRERERQRLEELEEQRRELELIKEREQLALRNAELAEKRVQEQATAKRRLLVAFGVTAVIAAVAVWAMIQANMAKDSNRQLALTNIIQRLQTAEVPALINNSQDDVAALLALQASQFGAETVADDFRVGVFNDTLAPDPFAHVLGEGLGTVGAVTFSPDGLLLAAAGDDNRVRLWTVDNRQSDGAPLDGPPAGVRSLAFSPDGQRLAVGGCESRQEDGSCGKGNVLVFDLASRQLWGQPPVALESDVRAVAFQPSPASDGQLLVWGSAEGQVWSWRLDESDAQPRQVQVLDGGVFAVAFSPDGRFLAVGGCEERDGDSGVDESSCRVGQVKLSDLSHQSPFSASEDLPGLDDKDVISLAFDEGGTLLAAASGGSDGGAVQLWDIGELPPRCYGTGESITDGANCTLKDPGAAMLTPVIAVAFKPGDREVVASDFDMVRFWRLDNPDRPDTNLLLAYPHVVTALSFRPTGDHALVTGSTDGIVRLWAETRSNALPVEHMVGYVGPNEEDNVWSLAFNPDPEIPLLASASEDGQLLLWDRTAPDAQPVSLEKPVESQPCNPDSNLSETARQAVWSLAISRDGRLLAAGYGDGAIQVWDVADRENIRPRGSALCAQPEDGQPPADLAVRSLSFNPDGHHLASGSWNGSVLVWDANELDEQPIRLDSGSQAVRAVSFSPDGNLLAVGGCKNSSATQRPCPSGGLVLIWPWQEPNKPVTSLCCAGDNPRDQVYSLAFNPQGNTLFVGTGGGVIRRWTIASSEAEGAELHRHSKSVRALLFPDDDTLISVSNDFTVLKWNLTEPGDEPDLLASGNVPQSAALSPDKRWVAFGDAYGKIQIARVAPEGLVDLVCPQVGRNLTQAEWTQFVGNDVPYEVTCQVFAPG